MTASINQKLLAANRLIYLNISIDISKIYRPGPLARLSLFEETASGETTLRYLFHEVKIAASFAKITIICENNYSR